MRMDAKDKFKLPRLYIDNDIVQDQLVPAGADQAHYMKNVMRLSAGDEVRIFNQKHGEFLARIEEISKKAATLAPLEQLKPQPAEHKEVHLYFAPLKKQRMDHMIEKGVELGVTHFYPFTSEYSDIHKFNEERAAKQVVEAAEQCERLDIPQVHTLQKLENILHKLPAHVKIYAGLERAEAPMIHDMDIIAPAGFIIGPVGGFSEREKSHLAEHASIQPISLGERVLRCETAALFCLSHVK